jgi:GT2 family glycosyltransferase
MPRYKVAVIIPVFNQWALTAGCLRSLREHTQRDDVQVIVVDNGSADETAAAGGPMGKEVFGERFEHVRLEENINFGPGCNFGASRGDADFLFFLNNDTLLTPGWLQPLLDAFQLRPRCGAVGPLLLYPDHGRVQHIGVTFTPDNHVRHLYHYLPGAHPAVLKNRELQAITGAALMIPEWVFGQAGRFWEEYRNGYEDLDLSCQIRGLGLTLHCMPSSRVFHLTSQTSGRFDAEKHNSKILSNRCRLCFQPDMHRFARADGYELRLTPALAANIVKKRPQADVQGFDMSRLWGEIQAEPLWEHGYERLFDILFAKKMWSDARDLLALQQCFFSSEQVVTNMARVASRMGDVALLESSRKTLESLRREAASKETPKRLGAIKTWALESGDDVLLGICEQWEEARRVEREGSAPRGQR